MPTVVSWSGLRRYEECAQKHLRTIQQKATPARDLRNFLPGTVGDRIMRRWLEQDDPKPGQMAAWVPEMFEHYVKNDEQGVIRWRGRNDMAVTRNYVREAVTLLEPLLLKYVLPYEYEPEMRFRAPVIIPYLDGKLTSIELLGGIDLVVRRPDNEYGIYDLKVTSNDDYWRKTLGQLTFYDLGLTNYLGLTTPPSFFGFIQPKCKQPVIHVSVKDAERTIMMDRIIRMAHGMWRKDWEPKESSAGCSQCEVKHACSKYAIDEIVNAQGERRASFGVR